MLVSSSDLSSKAELTLDIAIQVWKASISLQNFIYGPRCSLDRLHSLHRWCFTRLRVWLSIIWIRSRVRSPAQLLSKAGLSHSTSLKSPSIWRRCIDEAPRYRSLRCLRWKVHLCFSVFFPKRSRDGGRCKVFFVIRRTAYG